ncbi:Hypothetical protein SMAX5B_013029 [Scophthalmus maximus]|uniref:Uncharacterized protein n=1 Tax=Scophthalmus maximus TaxID=52904 RepID=A0A2U9BEF1_SCOMX|nr:Hypothetical protein SMAX5B_013029 [Scophthalmus maximus]
MLMQRRTHSDNCGARWKFRIDSRDEMRAPADTINNRMTPERISKGNALEDYRDFKSAVDPKTCPGVKPPDLLLTLAQTLTLNPV